MKLTHKIKLRIFVAPIVGISIMLTIILFLTIEQNKIIIRAVHLSAKGYFESIVITRSWNAHYGGIYVLKKEGMQSNPYLKNPDITTTNGVVYTKKNPALMTREISKLAKQFGTYQYHITSLDLINPNNAPNPWERESLKTFETGVKEVTQITKLEGKKVYRFMRPLLYEKRCVSCHAEQGYRLGDIRGGISVSLPYNEIEITIKKNQHRMFALACSMTIVMALIFYFVVWKLMKKLAFATNVIETERNELRVAQLNLTKERSTLDDIVSNIDANLFLVDRKQKILWINKRMKEKGLSDIIGQNYTKIYNNDIMPESRFIALVFEHEKIIRKDYSSLQPDGAIQWYSFRGSPIKDNSNNVIKVLSLVHDITNRKQIEKSLNERVEELANARRAMLNIMEDFKEASQKAEAATQAKSDLLANMSHEIRTPMNAIIGMSHLALQTNLNRKQRNYIKKVHHSGKALLGIINDILDFSKVEAGKLNMENIDFRLDDVFDNLANLVGLKTEEKGLELIFDIPQNIPTAFIGDPLRLGQILVNLGNNAVKFTEHGEIVISIEIVEQDDKVVKLHFAIRDTGVGMTVKQQDKLFKSFSQVDTSTTRKYGGTGLGLVISKKLTEMMGGEIWVESKVDVGSIFHFTIQLDKQQGNLRSAAPDLETSQMPIVNEDAHTAIAKLHGAMILLVEDNEINKELAMDLLTTNGINVKVANNGQEALNMLAKQDFDGVLMDCQMPVMDGYEATRKIREQECFKKLPVLAMTANTMSGDREKVIDAGMNDHIAKPIDVQNMFATMAKWITPSKQITETTAIDANKTATKEKIPTLPGIDVTIGLAICQGKHKLYKKLLIMFRNDGANFVKQFRKAQVSDDLEAATRRAHTLKSVAGNIGASNVQEASEVLEFACKENMAVEKIDQLLKDVASELSIVLNGLVALEQIKPKISVQEVKAFDPKKLNSLLSQLRILLEDDDTDATEMIEKLEELAGIEAHASVLKRLSKAISGYNFEQALEELDKLESVLTIN